MEHLSADNPVAKIGDDKFNRYPFGKRIADTIKSRIESDCLVIGIYGAWGEGKSTVLNFIHDELKSSYPNIVSVRFNPWRFKDEEGLIKGFYDVLSSEIQVSLRSEDPIDVKDQKKSWRELIGLDKKKLHQSTQEFLAEKAKKFTKYASVIDFGDRINGLAESLSSVELEDLKSRINTIITDFGRRLVISIDDIDRLDEDEVNAIFRLVKLNADFTNTTYILSFDDKMVAKMIASRYGNTDSAGENFLEKIVQVPLRLPKAYPSALGDYAIDRINNVLKITGVELTEQEGKHFGNLFGKFFQLRISTPRIALRYANSLNYSLALLKGYVNMVDLMCIEGIRVFYPQYYDFIIQYPDLFLESYKREGLRKEENKKIGFIKEEFARLRVGLVNTEKEAIEELLQTMFPQLKGAFSNVVLADHQITLWYINKRICSDHYFPRYFTLSLAKGDLSDLEFEQFIKRLDENHDMESLRREFNSIMEESEISNVVTYLRTRPRQLSYKSGRALSKFLGSFADIIERTRAPFTSPYDQTMFFINDFVRASDKKNDIVKMLAEILQETPSIDFASELLRLLSFPPNSDDEPAITKDESITLFNILKGRVLSECGDSPIFVARPDISVRFLQLWSMILGVSDVSSYLEQHVRDEPKSLMQFLKNFLPWYSNNETTKVVEGDFGTDQFTLLKKLYSPDKLYDKLVRVFGIDKLSGPSKTFKFEQGQNDDNILLQFGHVYRMLTPSSSLPPADGGR